MSGALTIGVDTGTSGCKAVLLDTRGRVVASSWATYPTRRGTDGEVTQNPSDWLRAVERTLRDCSLEAGNRRVAAIGITAPAHVAVLVGEDGEPLAPAMLAFDGRPAETARRLRKAYGESFFSTTYVELTEGWTFPQLAWLQSTRPELWRRIQHVLLEKDYIVFRLTGAVSTDLSDAAGTAMWDQADGRWDEHLCADVGLALGQLPPIRSAAERAGGLNREWARRTGISEGTPVIVGATDTAAELVSIGALEPGASLVKVASTGTVVTVCDKPRPHAVVMNYPHAAPGLWYTVAATSTAATAYHWLAELLAPARARIDPAMMNRLAARVPAGADGVLFLPFLDGERCPYWDRDLRAAFLGVSAAHKRAHFCRAVLEGVAYSLRSCRDVLAGLGLKIESPDFTGGALRSALWRTIVASVLGQDGTRPDPQGPAVGVALLANDSLKARPRRRVVSARSDWMPTYDQLYRTYTAAAERLVDVSHALAENANGRDGE